MGRREFLQLAKPYNPAKDKKVKVGGFYVSEKLDGTRAFWDGGLSRGLPTDSVPWASVIHPKTGQRKPKIKPLATGLWSRYGNPIIAPDWFLDLLPSCPLDGELWAGRGNFQLNRSIVAGDTPDPRFDQIVYAVYGTPAINNVIQEGEVKNANMHVTFDLKKFAKWIDRMVEKNCDNFMSLDEGATFEDELLALRDKLEGEKVYVHRQLRLPEAEEQARLIVEQELTKALDAGGEGVVIRSPHSVWFPKRHKDILKYKPSEDDEGRLVGFTSGRETDKGSKHLGKIGALILDYKGKRLDCAGLTDEEREFASKDMSTYARTNPDKDMPESFQGKHFKVGQLVTFKYRELSDDGIPKEARYFRKREDEE
jgi:DNA ligase-1